MEVERGRGHLVTTRPNSNSPHDISVVVLCSIRNVSASLLLFIHHEYYLPPIYTMYTVEITINLCVFEGCL
jgi:hypothetical protein